MNLHFTAVILSPTLISSTAAMSYGGQEDDTRGIYGYRR